LLDGVMVFAGGLLLALPGFITDIAGLLLMLPPVRVKLRRRLLSIIKQRLIGRRIENCRCLNIISRK
jgi:UPF0716 protein FxsA